MEQEIQHLFTGETAAKLARISRRRCYDWIKSGLFRPAYDPADNLFTFRDVVSLRTLAVLRDRYHVDCEELRTVGAFLEQHRDSPWSTSRFWVLNRHVHFKDPEGDDRLAGKPFRQVTIPTIELESVEQDVRESARRVLERSRDQIGRVVHTRGVVGGAPRLDGTRIPTATIWEFHKAGYDANAIICEYPSLTLEDVEEALKFEKSKRTAA